MLWRSRPNRERAAAQGTEKRRNKAAQALRNRENEEQSRTRRPAVGRLDENFRPVMTARRRRVTHFHGLIKKRRNRATQALQNRENEEQSRARWQLDDDFKPATGAQRRRRHDGDESFTFTASQSQREQRA
ncbi:hypothetical protein E2542_SST30363 [Spatholobus suberectus]|nr:hypothetical protein E2542_SST30363 [Spatholobus suberectus]